MERTEAGVLRLRRTRWGRLLDPFTGPQRGVGLILLMLGLAVSLVLDPPRAVGYRPNLPQPVLPLCILGPWVLVTGAYAAFGRRELEMSRDFLRTRWGLGPWDGSREYRTAALRMSRRRSYRGHVQTRLDVAGLGGSGILGYAGLLGTTELERLGRLISQETGWELRGERAGGWI